MDLYATIQDNAGIVRTEFDPFFRAHFEKVARAAALVAGDAGTGQDAAQEAFLGVYQRWASMESDEHALNFAYKAALNRARSHLRKYLRLVPSGLSHADDKPGTRTSTTDEWIDVAEALGALPRRQRACVVLVDYADMDPQNVARTLGISPSTVRVHLMRGRQALRERFGLQPMEEDDEV